MEDGLRQQLAPIRLRLRIQSALRVMGMGALIGGVIAALLGVAHAIFHSRIDTNAVVAIFFMSSASGALIGLLKNRSWVEAATMVDEHYRLQDGIVSALQFSSLANPTPFHQLQLANAGQQLQRISPSDVVPWVAPWNWRWTAVLLLISTRLLMSPATGVETQFDPPPPVEQLAQAVADITTEIDQLDEIAHETAATELQELVTQLKQDLKRLNVAEQGAHESLKTISEMQQKMQSLMSEMNVEAMDAQLKKVGEALSSATPLKPAADALQKQDLQKAADELAQVTAEDLNADKLEKAQVEPTAEKLAEAAQAARDQGLDDLSETLDKLAEAMKSGDSKQASDQTQQLAETVKRHSLNKQLNQLLDKSSDQLGQSKQHLAAQSQSEGEGAMSGSGQNLTKGKSDKTSNSSSQKAGAKSAGNIDGTKTQLDSQRQMARLSGQLGEEGDSEVEITSSPDAQQQAQRQAQETFAEYQKMSEAVLDAESIPMGHRQTIRRYFESIRPTPTEKAGH